MSAGSLRERVLLALARADGQPWASIAEATPHTAEVMYGRQADAIEALWREHSAARAGVISIPAPAISTGPKGKTETEAAADYLREMQSRTNLLLAGSGVTALVDRLLADVVAALDELNEARSGREPASLLDPSHRWGTCPLMERIKPGTRIRVRDIPVCLNCLVDGCEGETAAFEPCRRTKNPAHHKECTTDE